MKLTIIVLSLLTLISCQPEPKIQRQEERTPEQRERHPNAEDTEYLRDEVGIHGVQH